MTIRSRMLLLLLPTLLAFVGMIALFFYFNWSDEILDSFKSRLQSIVTATAPSIDPKEIRWVKQHLPEPGLESNPTYQSYRQQLVRLKQKLPINNFYVVMIEPVKEGEAVLPNQPENSQNAIHEGQEQENAYRQVFLIDASDSKKIPNNAPGDIDFSETGEQQVYLTKKTFVTPIYEARKTHERFMSAYAPIMDTQGQVVALLGADVSMQEIDRKLRKALLMIFLGALATILLATTTVFVIADRISKPVQQLNQAALDIAAGDYEANIQVQGPREIVELANTLNTMSECLVENISRLRETSLIRERMYGEYECTLLLQHYMLQKVINDFKHPQLQMRITSGQFSPVLKGLLLKIEPEPTVKITILEAEEGGFAAVYQLISHSSLPVEKLDGLSFVQCQFLQNFSLLTYQSLHLFPPLVWSVKSKKFINGEDQKISLNNQDMIFLFNSEVLAQFETQEKVERWLAKVLRHFAEDGLEIIHTMLTNELNFLAKKESLKRNFQILSLQVKTS